MPPKSRRKSSLSQDTSKQSSLLACWSGAPRDTPKQPQVARKAAGGDDGVPGNLLQDLLNTFIHYEDILASLERERRLGDDAGRRHVRVSKKRGRESDEFLSADFLASQLSQPGTDVSADEFGFKYVDIFCLLMDRGFGCPSRECKDQLMAIISNDSFHQSRLLSSKAASALSRMNTMFPPTKVKVLPPDDATNGKGAQGAGSLLVEENSGAWQLQDMTRITRWQVDEAEARSRSRGITTDAWKIMAHFVEVANKAAADPHAAAEHNGCLLMLEQAVTAMQQDFCSRLEVFESCASQASKKLWPMDLLQGSYLGRLLELAEASHHKRELPDLVQGLVRLIGWRGGDGTDRDGAEEGGGGEGEASEGGEAAAHDEPALYSPFEIAQVAQPLLHMILEYLGILESAGKFYNARSAGLFRTNLRVEADVRMFAAFQELSTEQQAAFLCALPARDRIRFCGQVVARFRAKREKTDSAKWPELVRVETAYGSTTVSDYIDVDFLRVMAYVASDDNYASNIKGIGGRDGLVSMLCAGVCATAEMMLEQERAEANLLELEAGCDALFAALREGAKKPLLLVSEEKICAALVIVRHAIDSACAAARAPLRSRPPAEDWRPEGCPA